MRWRQTWEIALHTEPMLTEDGANLPFDAMPGHRTVGSSIDGAVVHEENRDEIDHLIMVVHANGMDPRLYMWIIVIVAVFHVIIVRAAMQLIQSAAAQSANAKVVAATVGIAISGAMAICVWLSLLPQYCLL